MNRRLIIGSLALLAIATAASAQPHHGGRADLPPMLVRALHAAPHLRYVGTRIVEVKVGPDRLRHTEYVIRDGSRTRIEFPDEGPYHGQIIVETGQERRHYLPDKNEVRILPPRREESFERLGKLVHDPVRGRVQFAAGDSIAGFKTGLVTILDSAGSVQQRIWIEPRSGMMLKRELYDKTGNLRGFSEFTKLDLDPIIHPSDFVLQPRGAKIITPRDTLRELIAANGFQDVSLPPGDTFKLEHARVQKGHGDPTLVQVYVSNEGRFSLFQVRAAIDPSKLRKQSKGEFHTFSWQHGGASFVIIGELSEERLRQIAQKLGA